MYGIIGIKWWNWNLITIYSTRYCMAHNILSKVIHVWLKCSMYLLYIVESITVEPPENRSVCISIFWNPLLSMTCGSFWNRCHCNEVAGIRNVHYWKTDTFLCPDVTSACNVTLIVDNGVSIRELLLFNLSS